MSLSFDKRPVLINDTSEHTLPAGRQATVITTLDATVFASIKSGGEDAIANIDDQSFPEGITIRVPVDKITLTSGAVLLEEVE